MASTTNGTDVALLSVRTVIHGRKRDLSGFGENAVPWGDSIGLCGGETERSSLEAGEVGSERL